MKANRKPDQNRKTRQAEDPILYLASLVNVISDALISTDMDFNILEWNPAAESMYGWEAEEVIGRGLPEFIQSEFMDTTREDSLKAVMEQGIWKGEVSQRRKDGTRIPIAASVSLVRDETGRPAGFVSINRDITELKQAEAILHLQNQRLKILRDIDTGILAANSVESIARAALSQVRELIGCQRAHISLFDWEANEAVIFSVNALNESFFPIGTRVPLAPLEDLVETLSQNQLLVIEDLTALPDPPPLFQAVIREGSRSLCILPLVSQGTLIGTFNISSVVPGFFDEEKIALGRDVANQVVIAITQNRLMEALREERNRQKNVLDGMLAFVGLISLDGTLLEINRAALLAVGMKTEEIIGKPVTDLPLWSDSELTRNRVRDAIRRSATGELVRSDFPVRLASGQMIIVDILFNPLRDSAGNIVQVVGSGVDITERKRAEEALRENESRLQSIIDTEPECVKVLDLNGGLLEMNPAGLAMIEADRMEDVIGKEVANLVVPEHRMAFRDLTHSISKGETGTLIFEIQGLKGTRRWLETHAVPLRDKMGSVTAILGITLDITERKRAEGQIQRQIQYLRALHTIDTAISSSFDLRMTLGVLLNEVLSQLGVDAADVLLFNQPAQILEYAAARGFQSDAIQYTQLRLGEGFAGRAIVERRIIHIPNMLEAGGDLVKSLLLAGESFVTYFGVPLIAKGQVEGVLEIFHRSPLEPDQEWMDFLEALAKQAAIAIDNAQLLENLQHSNTELIVAYDATLEGWSRAMDLRDKETEGHTQRVTEMAVHLAQFMGIQDSELMHIRRGGMLHDIGKLGVPDSILLKPDRLTDNEWAAMRLHPQLAYEMLSPITYLKSALDIPYCHHERWDGTGYPRGLKGTQIPLAARMFAVVDVWDAVTSNRPYRGAWSREQALDYIRGQAGKHFDPYIVDAFLHLIA